MEVLAIAGKEEPNAHDELHAAFNNQGYSNYVVVYLRLLASGQLQQDADFYQHFIEGDRTITEFCHQVCHLEIS